MIDAAIVGAALNSAVKYALPNVENHYPGKSADFMAAVMHHLRDIGVPGAQNLVPHTPIDVHQHEVHADNLSAPFVGTIQNSGYERK